MKYLILIFLLFATSVGASELSNAQQALHIISDFADRLCSAPPIEGGTQGVTLTVEAQVELNEVLKKVGNLGGKGAATYQSDQYRGLLQKDLVSVLKDSSNCRLEIWRDLKDKLLPVISTPLPGSSSYKKNIEEANDQVSRARKSEHSAKSMVAAEAAIRTFSIQNYPIVLDPSPQDLHTLSLLFERGVRAEKIDVYLDLMANGLGLHITKTATSFGRVDSILDAAAQVSEGSNVGPAVEGQDKKERIRSVTSLLRKGAPYSSQQSIDAFRSKALRYPFLELH